MECAPRGDDQSEAHLLTKIQYQKAWILRCFWEFEAKGRVMVKKGFFNHYSTHYFFKLFLERVLAEDQEWAWKNTITLDNSRVQKNKFNYKKLLIHWKLSIAWTAPYSVSFFYLFIIFSLLEAQLNLLLGL